MKAQAILVDGESFLTPLHLNGTIWTVLVLLMVVLLYSIPCMTEECGVSSQSKRLHVAVWGTRKGSTKSIK